MEQECRNSCVHLGLAWNVHWKVKLSELLGIYFQ